MQKKYHKMILRDNHITSRSQRQYEHIDNQDNKRQLTNIMKLLAIMFETQLSNQRKNIKTFTKNSTNKNNAHC